MIFGRWRVASWVAPSAALILAVAIGSQTSNALAVAKTGDQAQPTPPFLGESSTPKAAPVHPAAAVPAPGFQDTAVISGLTNPTNLRFASDGRIFIAEKSGVVKVFDGVADTTPTVVADLSPQVDNYWDRGLLGLALDPNFPTSPYLYLLYTYDALPGGTAPLWNDGCPTPPGPTTDGCVVNGRLVRITLSGDVMTGSPQVLIKDQWCQQYPSHSIGDLVFGPDGALYVSGGDGASWTFADYGQGGGSLSGTPTPKNPCGDPPAGVGGTEAPPTAEGGALRSQSPGRAAGPVLLNGSILRVDPATGAGLPDNPNGLSSDPNTKRIIAYGLRNPFRFTFRPGTSELWIGDVGYGTWEEINRRVAPTDPVQNFGWPCYEGNAQTAGYSSAGLNICTNLYNAPGSVVGPFYNYQHGVSVVPGDGCPLGNGSVVSGVGFYQGGSYPASYNGALFFADHSRNCIWAMRVGANGLPDPTKLQTIVSGASNPVDIESGPGGDLFYVDFDGGTIHRITSSGGPADLALNQPASASSTESALYPPSAANDGDSTTRWSSSAIDNQWWQVDLGSVKQFDTVALNWEAAYASTYKIQVSSDGSTFADAATVGNSSAGFKTTTFPAVSARYVRVLGVTRATSFGISFWDAQVFNSGVGGVPVNSSPPTVSGLAGQGQSLTASNGIWSGSPTSYAYQWQRCDSGGANCQPLAGSTAVKYTLGQGDIGQTVRVTVTATNGSGASQPAASAVTAVVRADLALSQPTSASSTQSSLYTSDRANDGNSTTRWSSSFTDNQWWQVDLGSVKQVDTVALNWENAYASTYKIQVSSNGSTFTDTATVGNSSAGWKITSFTAVSARYVRILGVTRATVYGISFWDAQVFGSTAASSPVPVIDTPSPILTWAVGDLISFSGHATDPAQGALPPSALTWSEIIHHCTTPSDCHTHLVQTYPGVASGSLNAPDHDYPSWLELQLTATNSTGQTGSTSVRLDPKTVDLAFASNPTGLTLTVGSTTSITPFTRTVIVNSANSISAPLTQSLNGTSYSFVSWSDSGAATHNITAPTSPATYTATYQVSGGGGGVPVNTSPPTVSGLAGQGQSLTASNGTWSGSPTSYAYQWQRCDSGGANCQPLAGSTAVKYTLAQGDIGQTVRVTVTATNGSGASQPAASTVTAVVRADLALSQPTSASSTQNSLYTSDRANDGNSTTRWSSAATDNQWWQVDLGALKQVDTVALNWENAYASTYKIQLSSNGSTFTDAATVSNSSAGWKITSFASVSARYVRVLGVTRATVYGISFWDAQVFGSGGGGGGGVPVNTSPPTVSGLAGQGQSLTASTGIWSGSPTSYAYQWQRCDSGGANCQPLAGSTAVKYTLGQSDIGQTVRVTVTATNGSGASQPAASAVTAIVRADLALSQPTSASSTQNSLYTSDRANDGNSTTRWSSSFTNNQWWQVDLGSVKQVDTVALNWENAYASTYKIQLSSNGSTFTDAATVSNSSAGWKITSFASVSARYVRVLGVTRATAYGISFWDAQVFGG